VDAIELHKKYAVAQALPVFNVVFRFQGQFPPPIPDGYLPPSGAIPSSSQPSHPADANPVDVPRAGPGTAGRAPMNPQMSWINDDYLPVTTCILLAY